MSRIRREAGNNGRSESNCLKQVSVTLNYGKESPIQEMAVILLLTGTHALLSQQYGMRLMPGSTITVSDGAEITITDGSLVNDGSFISQGEGTVIFNGTTIHEIGGAETTAFSNLTVNNTAGLGITGGAATVSRILLCNGLLETNGKMTLLSGGTVLPLSTVRGSAR